MGWSWRLGTIASIGVYVHATFFIIIAWVVFIYWNQGKGFWATLDGVVFVLAIFGCVVLHELGHALTARKYGIQTKDITLLPIGGVARLERMPDDPHQELWVALMGPAVNVVISAGLYLWLSFTAALAPLEQLGVVTGPFLERLMVVNIFLAVFNMLPAFPMDGGRVLRALLAIRMDYTRATQIAASWGQAMALLFGFLGVLYNPFLIFIALFVWIGATHESGMVQVKSALGNIPVGRVMITDFQTLTDKNTLADAVELILAGSQQDFPVLDHSEVVGVLTRSDLLVALAKRDPSTPVAEVMQKDFRIVGPLDMLEGAFSYLQGCQCRTLPVERNGQLVGLLTMDNVGEFISIQSALKTARAPFLEA